MISMKTFSKLVLSIGMLSQASAVELKDVGIHCKRQKCELSLTLKDSKDKFPGYYQKANSKGVEFGFSYTSIQAKKYGSYPLKKGSVIQEVLFVNDTTPKGTPLLKIFLNSNVLVNKSSRVKKNGKFGARFEWDLPSKTKPLSWKLSRAKLPKIDKKPAVKVAQADSKKQPKKIEKASKAKKEPSVKMDSLEKFISQVETKDKIKGTSNVFSLKPNEKKLVVTKDKVPLYEKSEMGSKVLFTLGFGDELIRTKVVKSFFHVKHPNGLKGYVKRNSASYEEELSAKQQDRLKKLMKDLVIEKRKSKSSIVEDEASAQWLDKKTLRYSSFGRRDPFIPLKNTEVDGISIDEIRLVGIVWDDQAPLVLLEDVRVDGVSYTLREGDPIINGKVYKITRKEVIFEVTEFGVPRKFSMPLPDSNEEEQK